MTGKVSAPYGKWPSRITPQNTGGMLDLSEPAWNSEGCLFWRERSSKLGSIQMLSPGGGGFQTVSGEVSVGGGLLYGGGSFGVRDDWLIFIDRGSRQLIKYHLTSKELNPLSSQLQNCASPVISPDGQRVLFVHSNGLEDALYLTAIDKTGEPEPIIHGADFYNYPRWHPDGQQAAWISWNHPYMPWDASSLWLGSAAHPNPAAPSPGPARLIAGGDGISVLQPEFSPDGKWLAFLSDQSGWWQLWLYDLVRNQIQQLTDAPAEHALPPWLQNRNAFGFSPDSQRIYFLRNKNGIRSLWAWDLQAGEEREIQLDESYTWLDWFSISPLEDRMALVASAGDLPPRLITVDITGRTEIIRQAAREELPRKLFSIPRPISWRNPDSETVQGLYYPPHNPDHQGDGEPPLLLIIHSGPTRQKFAEFQPRTQFFTSRGFAVLEVNYRGSSGYGRAYRQSLQGEWGEAEVKDCLSGAQHVSSQGWADRGRMALLGSSSGGFTVYQILVKYPGIFQAAIVLYGIVNQLDLLKAPTKFERHYSDWLIGPYPAEKEKYTKRSPVFFADRIQDPIAVFQGGSDPIVPRDQADQIIEALEQNKVPHIYTLYPEEGHGFKIKENVADFYQQSLQFLQDYLLGDKGESDAQTEN